MQENCIYFVISKTNTALGRLIRFYTGYAYNHVSISLCESLQPMYSFARITNNVVLDGGFVEESWRRYLFEKRDVAVRVYKIPVDRDTYGKIAAKIDRMHTDKAEYRYDTFQAIGLFPTKKRKKCYTCLSFASEILGMITKAPVRVGSIAQLCDILCAYEMEEMVIRAEAYLDYPWGNDKFFASAGRAEAVSRTCRHFAALLGRR